MTNTILVLGGGHQGLAMSAHLALLGEKVNLWNRTLDNIFNIINTKTIICSGVVSGEAKLNNVSSNIDDVNSDIIMITTPATAHRDIAKLIAKKINKDTVIILNPGRTFGALEFAKILSEEGCTELPYIAETQTIIYTCRRNGNNVVTIYTLKNDVKIAALRSSDIGFIISKIPECIRNYFVAVESVMETSLSNIGMVLHCAPVLMNIGWIENDIVDFKYYYDGISPSIAVFLEKLDKERLSVAKALGYNLESVCEWMKRTYNVLGNNLYECIRNNKYYKQIDAPRTILHRYLEEDVPCGLVPLESAGTELGVETPCVSLVIDLANHVLNKDYRILGRKYSNL